MNLIKLAAPTALLLASAQAYAGLSSSPIGLMISHMGPLQNIEVSLMLIDDKTNEIVWSDNAHLKRAGYLAVEATHDSLPVIPPDSGSTWCAVIDASRALKPVRAFEMTQEGELGVVSTALGTGVNIAGDREVICDTALPRT